MTRKQELLLFTLLVLGFLSFVSPSFAEDAPVQVEQVQVSDTSTVIVSPSPSEIIISAQSEINNAESLTAAVETQAISITHPTETITATISQAQASIDQAQVAVDNATAAAAQVDSATALVSEAEESVAIAEIAVESQTAVVEVKLDLVESATAIVNSNTTPGLNVTIYSNPGTNNAPVMGGTVVYTGKDTDGIYEVWNNSGPTVNGTTTTTTVTETFAGGHLNTSIGVTVNGAQISTTNNGGTYIGAIGFPGGNDPSLVEQGASKDTLITLPANTTSASFDVYAKNGDSTGTVTYTDGTTEAFIIQDNVNANYQNYVSKETFTAPSGKTIATILIPANWDYYAVDNISATSEVTSTRVITEDFQVKWEGLWTPQYTGTQYITAPADDGVRLYLDGELVINDWFDKGGGGSTADVMTTAGLSKQFTMWYYENGGGANVALMRYTGNGWEVIPASEFSTTTATTEQLATLATARNNLSIAEAALAILQNDLNAAEDDVLDAEDALDQAEDQLDLALLQVGTAVADMNNKVLQANTIVNQTLVNEAAERAAAEQARLAAIAAENARIAAAEAYAAEQARIKAEAEAKAAAEAAAKAEADRIAAEEAAKKAEADRIAAEEAAAKAKAEADKAEADRLAAELKAAQEAEAKAKAEAEAAKAEADKKAAEEAKAKADAEKAKAEADKAKAEADAAKAEQDRLDKLAEEAKAGKELSKEEVAAVVESLVADLKPGESISAAEVKASGVSYADLPPETPVEVRTDENGNALIITAEVAAQVELVSNPSALLQAAFTDPGAALAALGSIGADMTPAEREEATHMVVATVVATGAALNAVGLATGGGAPSAPSGGGSNGGTNSGGTRRNERW